MNPITVYGKQLSEQHMLVSETMRLTLRLVLCLSVSHDGYLSVSFVHDDKPKDV